MRFLKNKKASHVDIMISFAIFVVAVVYLFGILGPLVIGPKNQEELLEIALEGVKEKLTSNVTSISVYISPEVEEACVDFLGLRNKIGTNPVIVVDGTGEKKDYDLGGYNLRAKVNPLMKNFYKIYSSEDFENTEISLTECQEVSAAEYSLGLFKNEEYVYEKKAEEAVDYYQYNYDGFKTEVGLSLSDDFGFDFINSDGEVVGIGQGTNLSRSVYSKEITTRYINDDGEINVGRIVVRIW